MTPVESASRVLTDALAEFGRSLSLLTSFQKEGVVILDLLTRMNVRVPVITIDTGRLPSTTLEMIASVEHRYGVNVERLTPDESEVEAMMSIHGRDLFRDSVPQRMLCCNIRKVRPLALRMRGVPAYLTGIRRDQSPERAYTEVFDRSVSPVRISPLVDWTAVDVLEYTERNNLPVHALYAAGYSSIGCDPCTRAVFDGEHERAGRWWWEDDAAKECGIHISPEGRAERTVDVLLRELLERRVPA
jgi:phosphoadenylyl-sulfate reductase (thioredoxin)